MTEFRSKVALVTGAGRGLGQAVALELARQGLKVALVARSKEQIDQVAAQIKDAGGSCLGISFDLSNLSAIEELVNQIQSELGVVDILINCAAVITPLDPTWELDPDEWTKTLEINLVAPFRLARAILSTMRERNWGRIINISSAAAINVIPRSGAYCTSKAGLQMLSLQLGAELVDTGISVITLDPGGIDTAMQAEIRKQPPERIGKELSKQFHDFYTNGQLSSPTPVGKIIAALAGEAGEKFRGQFINIYDSAVQALLEE